MMKKNSIRLAWCVLLPLGALGCATAPQPTASTPTALASEAPTESRNTAVTPKLITETELKTVPAKILTSAAPLPAAQEPVAQNIWQRIRNGFGMPDLKNGLVTDKEQYYAARPDYMQRMTQRAGRYLYYIVSEVENRGMPTEIALLPFIESAFNPQAMSSAKASGMWQFIPGTGRHYGLRQTMFQDERRDVIESTRAALDYLGKLYQMFGDWHLALAAYNWGEGAVSRAIARNERAGLPTDYASLRMPNETQHYVPKLQAIKNIVAAPYMFGIALPDIDNEQYFTTITKTRDIDVKTAARFAEMSLDEFRALNPSFNKPVIVGATQPQIVLPVDKAEIFQRNLEKSTGPLSSFTVHTVATQERLETIAARYDTSVEHLRDINNIPRGVRLKTGATVLVPRPSHIQKDIPESIAANAILAYEPDRPHGKRMILKTRRGDTLTNIAKRHRVSVAQLREWNGLSGDRVAPGKNLVLYAPGKSTTNVAKRKMPRGKQIAKTNTSKKSARNPQRIAAR